MYYLKQILQQTEEISIKEIVIDRNLAKNIYEICKQYSNNILLVADENTAKLLDRSIFSKVSNLIITGNSIALVELVKNTARDKELIVAFGSGTVNDICKYASYLAEKDYISFPTAASMNGYTSKNASILVNEHKKSFHAHLAKAIYIDTDILINSPLRLTLSGFADFMCRSTVQADWLLSHLLLGTEYNTLPFTSVYEIEQILLKEYMGLSTRSVEIILLLTEALLISGIGMVIAKGSHSASQGEHMIAHAMEMLIKDYSSLHGEKVAVATITMANLQEKILSMQNLTFKPTYISMDYILNNHEFREILEQKQALHQKTIGENWQDISHEIKKNLLPAVYLQKIFADLSIPYLPEHLGWNSEQYYQIVNSAFATRDRFTFLDLAFLLDIL
ncbi:MAG: iron-containing alcohol dehydrogenase [Wolbachia endosymbiont of Tyrophagus putrescentiae]|nr:iron-containing alcohol dehydrogenase [Wolbachia endosymbiont of Tyrophagus putrescentiae]